MENIEIKNREVKETKKSYRQYIKYGLIIFVLIIGATAYWFFNRQNNQEIKDEQANIPQNNLPPAPSLDKEIIIKTNVPTEVKEIVTNKIIETRNTIKANPLYQENWIVLGIYYKTFGDYDSAIEVWEYAKVLNPQNFVPYNNIGDLYAYFKKDVEKSEENFTKALELAPNNQGLVRSVYDFYRFVKKDEVKANEILKQGEQLTP